MKLADYIAKRKQTKEENTMTTNEMIYALCNEYKRNDLLALYEQVEENQRVNEARREVEIMKYRYMDEKETRTPLEYGALIHKYWRKLHLIENRCDEFWSFREMLARDMQESDYTDSFNKTTDNDLLAAILNLDNDYGSEEEALAWILHCEQTEPQMKQPTEYTEVNFDITTSVVTDAREMESVVKSLYEEIIKLRGKQSMISKHGNYNNEHMTYFDGAIYGMEKAFEMLVGCSIEQYVYENEWRV